MNERHVDKKTTKKTTTPPSLAEPEGLVQSQVDAARAERLRTPEALHHDPQQAIAHHYAVTPSRPSPRRR